VTAHAIRKVLQQADCGGLYHLVAEGHTSWHGYASLVLDIARQAGVPLKVTPGSIKAVSSSEFRAAAKRPLNSRLDTKN